MFAEYVKEQTWLDGGRNSRILLLTVKCKPPNFFTATSLHLNQISLKQSNKSFLQQITLHFKTFKSSQWPPSYKPVSFTQVWRLAGRDMVSNKQSLIKAVTNFLNVPSWWTQAWMESYSVLCWNPVADDLCSSSLVNSSAELTSNSSSHDLTSAS